MHDLLLTRFDTLWRHAPAYAMTHPIRSALVETLLNASLARGIQRYYALRTSSALPCSPNCVNPRRRLHFRTCHNRGKRIDKPSEMQLHVENLLKYDKLLLSVAELTELRMQLSHRFVAKGQQGGFTDVWESEIAPRASRRRCWSCER